MSFSTLYSEQVIVATVIGILIVLVRLIKLRRKRNTNTALVTKVTKTDEDDNISHILCDAIDKSGQLHTIVDNVVDILDDVINETEVKENGQETNETNINKNR